MNKTEASQRLGHYLFFDTRLSLNHTKSCASCHDPQFAFTDGYRRSVSPQGENLEHNAPSLLNSEHYHFYDWNNPKAKNYIQQMQRPLYGKHPVELGLDMHWNECLAYLNNSSLYRPLFKLLYGSTDVTMERLEHALAAYLVTLRSRNAPFDQYVSGNKMALSNSAKRGLLLFTSEKLKCVQCHMPPDFTRVTESSKLDEVYANIGLYNIEGRSEYPKNDNGLIRHTMQENDNGKFRIPSLRNVELTAPYMHDGSVATLSEVIDIYAQGGRGGERNTLYGNGPKNKNKNPLITGFSLSKKEKYDLINFLKSLSDTSYLEKKSFRNPFDH